MEEEISKLTVGPKTTRTPQPKAPTLHVLVQFLSADRPLSAFDIRASIGATLSKGTIYPMLARLEQKGWLSGEQVAGLRAPKRVYRLTRTGIREVRALARQHGRMAGGQWIIDAARSTRKGAQMNDRPPENWHSLHRNGRSSRPSPIHSPADQNRRTTLGAKMLTMVERERK